MKRYVLLLIIALWGIMRCFAQFSNQNYIVTTVPTLAITDPTTLSDANSISTIQYFDGLGRPIQTVQKAITRAGKDLLNLIEYDGIGRDYKHWLPAPATSNTGAFVSATDFTGLANTQYTSSEKPYAITDFEPSPLNRVTGKYGAGASWYAGKKNDSILYQTNTSSTEVAYYFVNSSNQLQRTGNYAVNTLYKTIMADEDSKTTTEYKDKQGRVVLKRSDTNVNTYFVYNDLGQLSYVLPPLAADALVSDGTFDDNTTTALTQYAYLYKYDERGNNVVKRLPGCDNIYMVYDKANRLILSQDGNQRTKTPTKQWTVTKYDAWGRVIYTGLMNRNNSRTELATTIQNSVITEQYDSVNSTFNNTGYTCNYFTGEITPIMVNYYDNYNFVSKNSASLAFSTQIAGYTTYYSNAKGLLTGTRTYILGYNMPSYTATAMYYDDKGRVVQSRSTNFLGGNDNLYTAYDFTGKVSNTYKEHSIPGSSYYPEQYSYTYDQAGRLLDTNHRYGILAWVKLSSNKYDELGRLITNYRHNVTDSVKCEYNIRNWTTKLKSGSSFEENIYYNTNPLNTNPCYNGNISYSNWTYNGVSKGYAYTYDELNRLKDANFKQGTSTQVDGAFNESFTYDNMGNIQTLQRKKDNSLIDNLSFHYDGNQLTYVNDGSGSQNQYSIKEYQNKSTATSGEFAYDKNGNMKKDLDRDILTIRYNLLNLPDTIQFRNGNVIINRYDASGQKLRSDYYTRLITVYTPIAEGDVLNPENGYSDVAYSYTGSAYIGNMEYSIYKQKAPGMGGIGWVYGDVFTPLRMYNAEGFVDNISLSGAGSISSGIRYNYFRKDHLGNNREVWNGIRKNYSNVIKEQASTRQRTQYYPSGLPWAEGIGASVQSRKFTGKEFVEMHGYDCTELGAREFYNDGNLIPTPDPLAEKHYDISPYAYCAGNPMNRIDPDGMDWTITSDIDKDGVSHFHILFTGAVVDQTTDQKGQADKLADAITSQFEALFNEDKSNDVNGAFTVDAKAVIRSVDSENDIAKNETIFKIQNSNSKDLEYNDNKGNVEHAVGKELNGKEIAISEKIVPYIISGATNKVIGHEIGHTGGLRHPEDDGGFTGELFNKPGHLLFRSGNNFMFGGGKVGGQLHRNPTGPTKKQLLYILHLYNINKLNRRDINPIYE
jgi:RHS repeat-associated protein